MSTDGGPTIGDGSLQVVGVRRRSLFDAVRPGEVGVGGAKIRGPGGVALAALRHQGVTGDGHVAADAVVLGGRVFGSPREGWITAGEHDALAVGYGVAAVRQRRGAGGRTWVLMRAASFGHGRALEAAAALTSLPAVRLVPVVVGPATDAGRVADVLSALGVEVFRADNRDPWSVLSRMDQAVRAAETGAVAVVAGRDA